MRKVVLCAALVGVLAPSSVGAQSLILTESEALARLSTNGPRVRAIRAGIEVAQVDVLMAGRWPNPRLTVDRESVAGTTEYLTKLVRDEGVMDLEQAHWRLSAYPALAAGIKDRGWIREGAPADIVVYDYENLELKPQEKAFDFPADEWRLVRKASGYRWTLVNGDVTFEDGECTGATPGTVLRHGTA